LFACHAGPTVLARDGGNYLNPVALGEIDNSGPARDNHTSYLVADDLWGSQPRVSVVKNLGVCSAGCARHYTNLELALLWVWTLDILNDEVSWRSEHGCLHEPRFLSLTVI
jgi:hypothetical protein